AEQQTKKAKEEFREYQTRKDDLLSEIAELSVTQASILAELSVTQASILDALASVNPLGTQRSIAAEEDWKDAIETIKNLPAGQRKKALFVATVLAWKKIPFRLGGKSLTTGIDSTNFVKYVLLKAGVDVPDVPGVRPSEVMMERFKRTETP